MSEIRFDYNFKMNKIYIEISDICGLKCSFCPAPKGIRGEMDFGLFEKICREISSNKRLANALLCLHILGDPLRHKDIKEFFICAQEHGLSIDLVTSGFYQVPDFLLCSKALHQIAFSIDAWMDLSNPKPKYYLEKIFEYCSRHRALGVKSFVNLRLQDRFLANNKEMVLKIFNFFKKPLNGNILTVLQETKRVKLAEYIFLNITRSFEWTGFEKVIDNVDKKFCHGVSKQIGILADGRVVPCCMDSCGKIILGDINRQSLSSILDSKLAKKMIRGFNEGRPVHRMCQTCKFPSTNNNISKI